MPDSISLEKVRVISGKFPLLRSVSFSVEKGTVVIISGRSGGGKSAVLELMAGLRQPDKGTVYWDGQEIASLTRQNLLLERQHIGYMFQQDALIANYTVYDNIALPLRTRGVISDADVRRRVMHMLEEVALFDVEQILPETLSVGQRKRAAFARALVTDPEVLLLDEPTGGIDAQTAEGLTAVLAQVLKNGNKTAVVISNETMVWNTLRAAHYRLEGGRLSQYHLSDGSDGTGTMTERNW